jgi:molybdenum cofactor synthesis domain-containing protein
MEETVIRALAVTVSNRAAAGVYPDRSGPVLVELLRSAGCSVVDGPLVVPDGEPVEAALRDALAAGYDVVVTTGGTGLTPADLTPEMTRRVLEREIPGIAEALRSAGAAAGVPAAILSRGLAGVADRTLIVNLPGSTGGVRDGMAVLAPVLGHAISQINGGDHVRADSGAKRLPAITYRRERFRGMMGSWDGCAAGLSPSPSLSYSVSRWNCVPCG